MHSDSLCKDICYPLIHTANATNSLSDAVIDLVLSQWKDNALTISLLRSFASAKEE